MRKVGIALSGLMLATFAQATVTVAKYQAINRQNVDDWQTMNVYIMGLGDGILQANADLWNQKKPLLYCPPDGLSLNADNYVQLIDDRLKANAVYKADANKATIDNVLMDALKKSFPCKSG